MDLLVLFAHHQCTSASQQACIYMTLYWLDDLFLQLAGWTYRAVIVRCAQIHVVHRIILNFFPVPLFWRHANDNIEYIQADDNFSNSGVVAYFYPSLIDYS